MLVSKNIYLLCLPLLLLLVLPVEAQEMSGKSELAEGIKFYREGQYQQAIVVFRNIILDPAMENSHGDAFFWLSKSYIVLEQLDDAERSLESYLLNYPDHPDYSEGSYLKGRLLFMQDDLESAIQVFQSFISNYPKSKFISNAYFWVGESLFIIGKLDSANKKLKVVIHE